MSISPPHLGQPQSLSMVTSQVYGKLPRKLHLIHPAQAPGWPSCRAQVMHLLLLWQPGLMTVCTVLPSCWDLAESLPHGGYPPTPAVE